MWILGLTPKPGIDADHSRTLLSVNREENLFLLTEVRRRRRFREGRPSPSGSRLLPKHVRALVPDRPTRPRGRAFARQRPLCYTARTFGLSRPRGVERRREDHEIRVY